MSTRNTDTLPIQQDVAPARPAPEPRTVDSLRAFLAYHNIEPLPVAVTSASYKRFLSSPPEPRVTHALSQHRQLTDADGKPFTIGGLTEQDRYEAAERAKAVAAANKANARPIPASTTRLGTGSPEERAAASLHGQEVARKINDAQNA